eukprot:g18366.t1
MRSERALALLEKLRGQGSQTSTELRAAVRKSLEHVLNGDAQKECPLAVKDIVTMLQCRSSDEVSLLSRAADVAREALVGDRVSFVVNRNINFTNACIKKCGFCAFSRTGAQEEAYFLPVSEVLRRAREAVELGATEVCVQAGLPPQMPPHLYEEIARAIKTALPTVHLHAFSPEEVRYGAKVSKRTVKEMLLALKNAGVDTLPGTSAEILDDEVRHQLAAHRLSTADWLEVVQQAHELGLRTSSTMMYGHLEQAHHVAQHLLTLHKLQARTGGFTEFVPLSFVASEAPIWKDAAKRPPGLRAGPSGVEVLVTHAVSRLVLAHSIKNLQVSWVKEGLRSAQVLLLQGGVNDLGGTLMNESISTAAGASHGQLVRPAELRALITEVGRIPYQRTATYQPVTETEHAAQAGAAGLALDTADAERFGSFHKLVRESSKWRAREALAARGKVGRGPVSPVPGGTAGPARHLHHSTKPACRPAPRLCVGPGQKSGKSGSPSYRWLHLEDSRGYQHTCRTPAMKRQRRHLASAESQLHVNEAHTRHFHQGTSATRPGDKVRVTYSPSYTIVPTYECFNACSYCNFRRDVGKSPWLSLEQASRQLEKIKSCGTVDEILILSGEVHPKAKNRAAWLERIVSLCRLAIEHGMLPHTNAGPLSRTEMVALGAVNPSMGLMLEQTTPKLMQTVHRAAPSKRPQLRIDQVRMAGELGIAFTTGLLLGLGEAAQDRLEALRTIAQLAQEYGHIQEVILQPFSPGTQDKWQHLVSSADRFEPSMLPALVKQARAILPKDVVIQVPPNLLGCSVARAEDGPVRSSHPSETDHPNVLKACLDAGARDLGGISVLDEVNPTYAFPKLELLRQELASWGYQLAPRLCVHDRLLDGTKHRLQQQAQQGKSDLPALLARLDTRNSSSRCNSN